MTSIDVVFNEYSGTYDKSFSDTFLGRLYRQRVQSYFSRYWNDGQHILELNAGTGEDAIKLAELGNTVLATDISAGMLDVTNKKIASLAYEAKVKTQVLSIDRLCELDQTGFDGVLSNFGGLNCIADYDSFSRSANRLLKEEGIAIVVLMGPYVPWEWLWYSLRGQFRKAFRRVSGHTKWRESDIFYPGPGKFGEVMNKAGFELIEQEALGTFMPPSYVSGFVEKNKPLFLKVEKLEKLISKTRIALNLADHYLLIFRKQKPLENC